MKEPAESTEGQIEQEVAEFRKDPRRSNNWVGYLPGGFHRQLVGFIEKSDNPETRDLSNRTYPEFGGKSIKDLFKDVDTAIEEEKVPLDEIEGLMAHHPTSIDVRTAQGQESFEKLVLLTLTVYLNLRRRGYPRGGLIS